MGNKEMVLQLEQSALLREQKSPLKKDTLLVSEF